MLFKRPGNSYMIIWSNRPLCQSHIMLAVWPLFTPSQIQLPTLLIFRIFGARRIFYMLRNFYRRNFCRRKFFVMRKFWTRFIELVWIKMNMNFGSKWKLKKHNFQTSFFQQNLQNHTLFDQPLATFRVPPLWTGGLTLLKNDISHIIR